MASLVTWPGALAVASTSRPLGTDAAAPLAAPALTLRQLVGQKLVVAMHGLAPSADLLGRIQRGEVGGVILFGANIASAPQLVSLTRQLQQAATTGGRPPLLIATDQEGGGVKRLDWAPPTLSPPQMGATGSAATAAAQGKATGRLLACAGINNNLAPVADVPSSTASFMYQEGRTFSFDASVTASLSNAFASGLRATGRPAGHEALPGAWLRRSQHRFACSDHPCLEGCAGSRTASVPHRDRPERAADHAVECHLHRLRSRPRCRLVAGHQRRPAAQDARLPWHLDHRLADRHRRSARCLPHHPRHPGRPGRD